MNVLIVGGTSALAKSLIQELAPSMKLSTAGTKNCDYFMDISLPIEEMHLPLGFDVLIHLAASFRGKTISQLLDTENINALGTLKLSSLAAEKGYKHFVFVSSIYSLLPPTSANYSIYSLSKRHAEDLLELNSMYTGLNFTILRPAPFYGDSDDFRKHQPFLYTIADKIQRGENIIIQGKKDPKRNFLHVEDLCKIIKSVIEQRVLGTYNCSAPTNTSFNEIAQSLAEAFDNKSNISFDNNSSDIADNIFEYEEDLYRTINYYPAIGIKEGMHRIALHRRSQK